MRIPIAIEYIKALQEQRAYINRLDLAQIDFYEDGKKLDIPQKAVDDFPLTGLSNVDFVLAGYYKK